MNSIFPLRSLCALALGVLSAGSAVAQAPSYDVTVLGGYPGAYLTYPKGLNDQGVVVGMAMFIPGGLKGFTWSQAQGYALLPDPPGQPDFSANDITNAGVIAGDGGGDGGQAWRYTAGIYEMLGVLPGTAFARTVGLSAGGTVAGTCYGTLFYTPHHSFIAAPGAPMDSALDDSYAFGINDSDQMVGQAPGSIAYRFTPGSGVELLPPLGGRIYTAGYSINNLGHVVGRASSATEHSGVPFLFTDAAGMVEIGDFGGRAFARDVNDSDQVVGWYEPSSGNDKPWVWSPGGGVRFLNDEIDSALQLKLESAWRINAGGQILASARDLVQSEWVPVLLTPIDPCPGISYYCGAGQNPANEAGIEIDTCDSAAGSIRVSLSGGPPGQFTYLLVGDGNATISQPPGAVGDLCVAGGTCLGRYSHDVGAIDALGSFTTDIQNAASSPCGGGVNIDPGASWNFQYWHRQDQGQPATFSEAVAVTFH